MSPIDPKPSFRSLHWIGSIRIERRDVAGKVATAGAKSSEARPFPVDCHHWHAAFRPSASAQRGLTQTAQVEGLCAEERGA